MTSMAWSSAVSAAGSVRSSAGQAEQPLEGGVHQGALGGRGRRRLGQPVDAREPEGQGAVGEGRDLRRREAVGQLESHGLRAYAGGVTAHEPTRRRAGGDRQPTAVEDAGGDAGRVLERAEVAEVGELDQPAVRQGVDDRRGEGGRAEAARPRPRPTVTGHATSPRWSKASWCAAHAVDRGLDLGPALERAPVPSGWSAKPWST